MKEKCNICGKEFKLITNHIRSHAEKGDLYKNNKLSKSDYLRDYRKLSYKYNELSEKGLKEYSEMVKYQFLIDKELVTAYRNKYIEMLEDASCVTQYKSSQEDIEDLYERGLQWQVDWGLIDRKIRSHVEQKVKYGTYPLPLKSKKICFDIDSNDKYVTAMFVKVLEDDFNIDYRDILVTESNSKGYHVDLYFNEFIENRTIRLFDELVREKVSHWFGVEAIKTIVDSRGYGNNACYMPFSVNMQTGKYNGLVNKNLEAVDLSAEIDKLLNLQEISKELIESVVAENKEVFTMTGQEQIELVESEEETKLNMRETLKYMDFNSYEAGGISSYLEKFNKIEKIESGERNQLVFNYGRALVATGITKEESLYNMLIEFQGQIKGYTSSLSEIKRETRATTKSLLKKDSEGKYRYPLGMKITGFITKEQVITMAKIKKDVLRRLYLALVVGSNKFKKSDNTFEFAYSQMNSILGFSIKRDVLLQRIYELQDLGLVEVVRRGYKEPGNLEYETNIYRIIESPGELNDKNCYVFDDISLITYEKIIKATEELLSRKQIRNLCKNKTILKKRLNVFKTNEEAELIVKSREIV